MSWGGGGGGGGGGYGVEALCSGGDTLILVISRVYNYITE